MVEKTQLLQAWDTLGTDHDAILIKGKIKEPKSRDQSLRLGFTCSLRILHLEVFLPPRAQ